MDRFCNVIYAWARPRVKNVEKFESDLFAPAPGEQRPVTKADLDADASAFMAFAGAFGVKPLTGLQAQRALPSEPDATEAVAEG